MRPPILVTFLLGLAAPASSTAQLATFETGDWPNLQVAAQSKDATILAAGLGEAWRAWRWSDNWQPSYHNSPWNAWGSGDTASGKPASIEQLSDGSLASFWDRSEDGSAFLLIHNQHLNLPKLRGLTGPARLARAHLDSRTNLWVTEAGMTIGLASGPMNRVRQKPDLIHAITVNELWPGGNPTNRLPVSMIEDARGRIWFWSNCQLGGSDHGAVRGMFIATGEQVAHHPGLPGVPTNRISVLASVATNLWIAVRDAGIYSVNLDTLAGTRVAEPETNAFQNVQNIFTVGDDCYVISGAAWEHNQNGLVSSLWRFRNGSWMRLIDGLDRDNYAEQLAERRWLVTKEGLWLGSFGLGGWFVSFADDAKPHTINWQKNSPFDTIHRWFQLKDGNLLGLQFGRGGLVADPALLMQPPTRPPTASVVLTSRPLLRTDDGNIFAVLRGDESALQQWDGPRWKRHAFPDGLVLWGDCRLATDKQSRVWLIDQSWNADPLLRPSLIFEPATGRFIRFSSFRTALQTQAANLANSRLDGLPIFAAVFSADGRICYEDRTWNLCYFDGRTWREWHLNRIVNGGLRDSSAPRAPFFASDGQLNLPLNGTLWQLDELAGWKDTAMMASARAAGPKPRRSGVVAPANFPSAESIVADDHGNFWVVANKQLFKAGHGLRVPCFAPDEPQPFADGRQLAEVLPHQSGAVFLRTTPALPLREEYVLLPAHAPLPETTVQLVDNREDSSTFRLTANFAAPRFSWRVDEGAWSEASTNQMLLLDELSPGKHRLTVIAVDERLQADPTPAEISFEVKLNLEQRVTKWITQLGDQDFVRREAAIKSLARHPELALPALKIALSRETNPDRRWWLEAAVQQCQ
jgi:hypothetical protein